jgi:hypothetical protein
MARATGIIEKKTDESYPIGFRYRDPDLPLGVTITGVVATGSPAGLTVGAGQYLGDTVYANVSGGTVGSDYTVHFKTTLSDGKILSDDFVVKVR